MGFDSRRGLLSGDNPVPVTDCQRDRIDSALSKVPEGKGCEMVDDANDADLLISRHLIAVEKQDLS